MAQPFLLLLAVENKTWLLKFAVGFFYCLRQKFESLPFPKLVLKSGFTCLFKLGYFIKKIIVKKEKTT